MTTTSITAKMAEHSTISLTTDIGHLQARVQKCKGVDIVSCLNISFADISYRWAAPILSSVPWDGVRDCTKFGPQCPQAKDPLFPGHHLPVFGNLEQGSYPVQSTTSDEFKCLNLNILAPLENLKKTDAKEKLPVLVWAHGGAYWTGCGSVELYDASNIVARSVTIGSPLIVVTFNYRLGVLGFLHSRELALDAQFQSNVPSEFRSTANLGILDTFRAFEWVKKHIGAFGGYLHNITGMGESAGSAILNMTSVLPHLHLKIPRMILSSSTMFSNHLLPKREAQKWFENICTRIGVTDPCSSVAALRALDVDTLIEKTNFARISFRPILDGMTIPYDPRQVIFDYTLWDDCLEQIVIGHCENESFLRSATHRGMVPPLETTIAGRVPPIGNLRARAMEIYEESKLSNFTWFSGKNDRKATPSALCWLALDSHARYYATTQLLSESFIRSRYPDESKPTYKYIFSWAPQFWPKSWPATHTADILPMFLHRGLSDNELQHAHTFADLLIHFAAKDTEAMFWKPYEAGDGNRKLNQFQRNGSWTVMDEDSGEFGLRKDITDFWRDVVEAALDIGMEGWEGMIR
ncbi:alpha/beta-hydrolase [Mollisia scopiformis]|uniref:Alpha/beta-hydrolase n=1 Tax=Mollisia scopiformis TaxID=149040 RepID=A0A132B5U6_MOLSC|nr:alpha/beta-hydrolase [Mollisia scopiformis]KUJ07785.1 alpha/beta-hydrolase [Mollisia scopiformis]